MTAQIFADCQTTADIVPSVRVGVVGMGAIGTELVCRLAAGSIAGVALAGLAVRDEAKARARLRELGIDAQIISLARLAEIADLIVECAPAAILADIARPVLTAGKKLMVLSVGALLAHPDLQDLAKRSGGQILVPTGALLGLDAVVAAAEGEITSVRMITRKPVKGLLGAPYLRENSIDIENIAEPLKVFEGSAREAARGFPANVNVAVALSLAGIGPDRTRIEIWADPHLTRNTHRILVDSDAARLDMTIENIPSDNPRTGRITVQSVMAALRKLTSSMRVGT